MEQSYGRLVLQHKPHPPHAPESSAEDQSNGAAHRKPLSGFRCLLCHSQPITCPHREGQLASSPRQSGVIFPHTNISTREGGPLKQRWGQGTDEDWLLTLTLQPTDQNLDDHPGRCVLWNCAVLETLGSNCVRVLTSHLCCFVLKVAVHVSVYAHMCTCMCTRAHTHTHFVHT